ncbi:hypothetical protein [Streptomyces sp. NBC_01176]|uniref:hypothetical protein n=1 Tax=Streptomyces sp. NBC_01176 TaxID=2903760 RepID=UPI00386EE3D2|nr:hypothetical protein OG199_04275 [Streptomyces sp. NBC_01176]
MIHCLCDLFVPTDAGNDSASVTTNEGLYQESKHMHWHVCHRGESEQRILAAYGHHDG